MVKNNNLLYGITNAINNIKSISKASSWLWWEKRMWMIPKANSLDSIYYTKWFIGQCFMVLGLVLMLCSTCRKKCCQKCIQYIAGCMCQITRLPCHLGSQRTWHEIPIIYFLKRMIFSFRQIDWFIFKRWFIFVS